MQRCLFILSFWIISSCATTFDPSENFSPDSPDAVIIVGAEKLSDIRQLQISSFNSETKRVGGSLPGLNLDWQKAFPFRNNYVMTVKPGEYVVRAFVSQGSWKGCFYKDSLYFDAKPGTINYVGELTSKIVHETDIAKSVIRTGDGISRGQMIIFYKDINAPKFKQKNENELEDMQARLIKAMPNRTAPLEQVELRQTTFRASDGWIDSC